MAQFTTTPVVGGGTLVEGVDDAGVSGSTILNDEAWSAYQQYTKFSVAMDEFDAKVKEFFKPLTEAAEAVTADDATDWTHITVKSGVEGEQAEVIHLGPEGVILRIIAETDGSSLRWINGKLIALAV